MRTTRLQNQWPGVRILPLLPIFVAKPGPRGPGFIFSILFCRHFAAILYKIAEYLRQWRYGVDLRL